MSLGPRDVATRLQRVPAFVRDIIGLFITVFYEGLLIMLRTWHQAAAPARGGAGSLYHVLLANPCTALQRWALGRAVQGRVLRLRDAALEQGSDAAVFRRADVSKLPPPVRRYFETVLPEGTPIIRWCEVPMDVSFRLDASPDGSQEEPAAWRPCTATGYYAPQHKAMLWPATMQLAGPLVWVDGWDGIDPGSGAGDMQWRMCSLYNLVHVPRSKELDEAALQRFLSEAPLYPTALLPAAGVSWTEEDDEGCESAVATATISGAAGVQVSCTFEFDDKTGLIRSVSAVGGRARAQPDGSFKHEPWFGRWDKYVHVPVVGAAAGRRGTDVPGTAGASVGGRGAGYHADRRGGVSAVAGGSAGGGDSTLLGRSDAAAATPAARPGGVSGMGSTMGAAVGTAGSGDGHTAFTSSSSSSRGAATGTRGSASPAGTGQAIGQTPSRSPGPGSSPMPRLKLSPGPEDGRVTGQQRGEVGPTHYITVPTQGAVTWELGQGSVTYCKLRIDPGAIQYL